jgi:hypothetical protein
MLNWRIIGIYSGESWVGGTGWNLTRLAAHVVEREAFSARLYASPGKLAADAGGVKKWPY